MTAAPKSLPAPLDRAYEHYGIDPSHRKYWGGAAQVDPWCKTCCLHSTSNPTPECDLERARAADLRAEGFEVHHCAHCHQAYPLMFSKGRLCPVCRRRQDERDAQVTHRNRRGDGVYVSDHNGCVEKIPAWMVDWDGNRNG